MCSCVIGLVVIVFALLFVVIKHAGCEVALLQVFGWVCGGLLWVVDLGVWFVGLCF